MQKDLLWIAGAAGALTFFAVAEYLGFAYPAKYDTLSRFVATMGAAWPPSIYLFGFITGALAAHFWWAWPQSPMNGGGG